MLKTIRSQILLWRLGQLRRQGGNSTQVLLLLQQMDKYLATSPDYLSLSGRIKAEFKDNEGAWHDFDRAFALLPTMVIQNKIIATMYLRRGWAECNRGDWKAGLEDFNASVKYDPDNWDTYYCRGSLYFIDEDYLKAEADFTRSLSLGGASKAIQVKLLTGIQISRVKSGTISPTEGIQELEKWKRGYIASPLIWEAIAAIYAHIEDYPSAIKALDESIAIQPKQPYLYHMRGYYYHRSGHNDRALLNYQEVSRLQSNYAEAHNSIGFIFIMQGKYAEAAKEIELAFQLAPHHAHIYASRGHLHFAQGNFDQALIDFRYALALVTLQPTRRWIKAGEAVTLFRLGQIEEAKAIWQSLCQENDNYRTEQGFQREVTWTEPALEVARKLMAEVIS